MQTKGTTTLDELVRTVKAFADPVRLRLIHLIGGQAEVCVCHLHEALALPQPTVSRHLSSLRKAGVVIGRKDGLWVHYRLSNPSSPIHAALLGAIRDQPGLPDLLVRDRERLEKRTRCC